MKLLLAALALCLATIANAEPARHWPERHWRSVDPASASWPAAELQALRDYFEARQPSAVMLVRDGEVVAAFGDTRRKVGVASVRKSLLSALYGIAAAEGRISLDDTLAQLGIDDKGGGLTASEKTATVRDLLSARSGVYLPAAHETAEIRQKRPARGSHPPGSFWFYNNWDFNALGTIYRRKTGEDVFASFARRIAEPIGMEDFSGRDGRYALSAASLHPAYTFMMSARDLARFGLLFVNDGKWQGRQVVPAAWVRDATTAHSRTDRPGRGYGYMWWTLSADRFGEGAAIASGYGGQLLAIVPAKRLVMVQTAASRPGSGNLRTRDFTALLGRIAAAAP